MASPGPRRRQQRSPRVLWSPLVLPRVDRRAVSWALAWALGLVALALALERPTPLFVNLGAGDGPFARGFRGGWERDGLQQSGETLFRWTADGARLVLPVTVGSGHLTARLRVARFQDPPVTVTLRAGGRDAARWTQPRRGWRVQTVDVGLLRGPLVLQFRSTETESLGVALDWVEIAGAERLVPAPSLLWGLAALLLGVPLVAGALCRSLSVLLVSGTATAVTTAAAVALDRFGGLLAAASAGPAALAVAALVGALFLGLARAWPDHVPRDPGVLGIALGGGVLALLALAHPFFYYPDVDTHASFLSAIRSDAYVAWDPREYQLREGTWMREIAGRKVAFPYSPAFHLMAWPLALLFGNVMAVKALAALALAATVLLVHAAARAAGLGPREAFGAQALLLLLPVTASRLFLALFPTLLGQALDLLLLVHLLRRFPRLDGARDAGAAFLFLVVAQGAYTASLFNAAALVAVFVGGELAWGDRRRALRLLAAYALAATLVVGGLYGRFLPVLVRDVLPHSGAASVDEASAPGVVAAARRARLFYDLVYPLLLLPGLWALRTAPRHARRLLGAVLLGGLGLLLLRTVAPAVFRDAKEVELVAPAVAVVSAAGLAWLAARGVAGRLAALSASLAAAAWGLDRAIDAYTQRFLSVGRFPP
ncbi:MAG: hypothetical protein HY317_03995 [Acidobacteria bacterium]|nr:hypothetical protein [Acidobacteriota bacterium]